MFTEQPLQTVLRFHRRNHCFVGIGIKLLPYKKWYKIMCLHQCSCVSTQNVQRLRQQILMQSKSIKAEMWCDITAQWMTQFLKVWNETDIWARHRVNEREYGHFQQDNATAHTTKKSMASLIPGKCQKHLLFYCKW